MPRALSLSSSLLWLLCSSVFLPTRSPLFCLSGDQKSLSSSILPLSLPFLPAPFPQTELSSWLPSRSLLKYLIHLHFFFLSFFFLLFFFPPHFLGPHLGTCSCQPQPQPQQWGIQATSVTCTTAHSNARSPPY